MQHVHSTHKLVYKLNIPNGYAGRKGYGLAVIASNSCAEFMSVYRVASDLQCVWIKCHQTLFGLDHDVLLGAVYIKPQSNDFPPLQVREHFTDLFDELACVTQVFPHVLLCGDFNSRIGDMREVSDAHCEALVTCPTLQDSRRCECSEINLAGNLLVDIAAAFGLLFTTGRIHGDDGQPTYVGYPAGSRSIRRSRPDHILVSTSLFQRAFQADVCPPFLNLTDHGSITLSFNVPDFLPGVDWSTEPDHVCGRGVCASKLNLFWKQERQALYVDELEKNLEMPVQLEAALEAGNVDTACFCLRSWIMQAATEPHVGMCKMQQCIFRRTEKHGIRRPVWFDAQCRLKRRCFFEAVKSGGAVHACQYLKKESKKQNRRARRAYDKYQKAVFLDRLHRHTPDIHELMRKPRRSHPTPITAEGWSSYLQQHFGSPTNTCSPSSRAAVHVHGTGSCPESIHQQEPAPCMPGSVAIPTTCPFTSVPHIPAHSGPLGTSSDSTVGIGQGIWGAVNRGVEWVSRTVRGVAQSAVTRWTGGASDRHVTAPSTASPRESSNPHLEQLDTQGAGSQAMPASDDMEMPAAPALYPAVCHYMRRLNPRTSPGFGAIAAPFLKYAEKRVPAVNGRGTEKINVLAPYVARLFAAMMEKAEIPA